MGTAAAPETTPAKTASKDFKSAKTAPRQTAAPVTSRPTTSARQREALRQSNSLDRQVVPVVNPAPAAETPAPVAVPEPPALTAEAPRSPAAPIGRVFQQHDVDESPQIATRVEPQLPGDLPVRPPNDVVVVRVLVSHTGHPSRVSLLRGSRLGRSSDDAVMAAVTQWTFSPARKKGEAVNCWYNIGVPLARAN
jgi:TonB family protein